MAKKRGLGRGLDSLIPKQSVQSVPVQPPSDGGASGGESAAENEKTGEERKVSGGNKAGVKTAESKKAAEATGSEDTRDRVLYVKMSRIDPDKNQPRKNFDKEKLEELADSIKKKGVLQPILVQETGGRYTIIVGERRWRAAKIAGLKEIPVIIRDFTERERAEAALIENIQREDLNVIEEAKAYQTLIEEYNITQEEVAAQVSKSRTAVTNILRLLKLSPEVRAMVSDGKLSMGQARALVAVEDPAVQKELAEKIIAQDLNVREVEKLIKKLGSQSAAKKTGSDETLQAYYSDIESRLNEALGMKVNLHVGRAGKGKVEITFANAGDLEKIMERIFV